jgi:hypothetical protein
MVAPTSVAAAYLTQIWSGATVVCIVWFLYRWKTNVFARIVTGKSFAGPDKERYLTMDHLSSLGLLILGCMAVAEACGMAVQSILTVGGIGGEDQLPRCGYRLSLKFVSGFTPPKWLDVHIDDFFFFLPELTFANAVDILIPEEKF